MILSLKSCRKSWVFFEFDMHEVTVSVLPLWSHTALVPVSGWVRTEDAPSALIVASSWAFTTSGLPVFIRAVLIQRILGLCVDDLLFPIVIGERLRRPPAELQTDVSNT